MNREIFIKNFNKASSQLDKKRLKKMAKREIQATITNDSGEFREYIIIMEELAEFSKEVSKLARGKGDKVGLIEEMADVLLSFVKIQHLCDISTLDLYKAINVKLDRMENVLKEEKVYL